MQVYTIVDLQYVVRGMIARIPELNHIAVLERWPGQEAAWMDPGEDIDDNPPSGGPRKYLFFLKTDIDEEHMAWIAEWDLSATEPKIFREARSFRKTKNREYVNLVAEFIEGLE